jgi:ABC-2 type transport system permease protein
VKATVIAANSLRRFFRDRTALVFTAILPLTLIFLIGSATASFDDPEYTIGVLAPDAGPLARELRSQIERDERIDVEMYTDRESLAKDVRRAVVPAGIVIPHDYDEQLLGGKDARVELVLDQTRGSAAPVRALVSEAISQQGALIQAASFTSDRVGVSREQALAAARQAQPLIANVAVDVDAETVGESNANDYLPPGLGYQAPSNLILFVFITSLAASALMIQSRQLRVTQRMFSTPTSTRAILGGEALARFAIAGLQAIFIFAAGLLLFGVEWGQPLGAAALIFVWVLVGTSVGMLFGTIFSTPEQAGAIGPMAGIAMGMLGGCMWPLEIVPETMQRVGHVFPHAWAMDAWIDLVGRGGSISDIGTELGVLALYVVVLMPLATWRLRRAITGP